MKTIYLVRHGESESNARTITAYKGLTSKLTEKGREQAEAIARRVMHIPFEALISSPWIRAHDTAMAISEATGKTIETSELFTETRAPSSLVGRSLSNAEVQRQLHAWNASIFNETDRVEDGENFADLKLRARDALHHLEGRPEETILVATHGLFLRLLMAYILIGDSLSGEQFRHFLSSSKTDNTGITIFTYGVLPHHETDASKRWRVRVFNDHSHLG